MGEPFEGLQSKKSFRRLADSIPSLLGLKTNLTRSWAESVLSIIKGLPSAEQLGSSHVMIPPHIGKMDSTDIEDVEMEDGDEFEAVVQKIRVDLATLDAHLNQLNSQRRQALNDFLDLKGNIRVFCRIRPFLPDEKCSPLGPVITSASSTVLLKISENKRKQFHFDKVFHQHSRQEDIFNEVEPVVKSALDGYNVCIFAYGQTGTGKTFTMEGKSDYPGVVPRALDALIEQGLDSHHRFLLSFSMLEIYMGCLRDLLVPQTSKSIVHTTPCLSIQMGLDGCIEIENLKAIQVRDFEQVKRLYRFGSRQRSTASTLSNATSSRSHCLIRISITCSEAPERRRETNKIWMIDLGGSERLLRTQARGKRLEEGKAINLSLSALGDVISALQRKKPHVPYRNSKLTQILRDSLGEDSKTLLLVHASPKEEDLCETIYSLGFATRMRSIHLGHEESMEVRAEKEVAMTELLKNVKNLERACQNVRREIETLSEKLTHSGNIERVDAAHLYTEEVQSNLLVDCDPQKNKYNAKDVARSLIQPPRFMRSTICSQQKAGVIHQTLDGARKKPSIPLKRRKPSSVYAESVTSHTRGICQSEYGSECSMPRISSLDRNTSADSETECSHDASECEMRPVDYSEHRFLGNFMATQSSKQSKYHQANKVDQNNFMIDNCFHFKRRTLTSVLSQQSKRVLALPLLKKNKSSTEENNGNINSEEDDSNFQEKCYWNGTSEQFSEAGLTRMSIKKVEMDETESLLAVSLSDMASSELYEDKHVPGIQIPRGISSNLKEIEFDTEKSMTSDQSDHTRTFESSLNTIPVNSDNVDIYGSHKNEINSDNEDIYGSQQNEGDVEKTFLHTMRSRRALFMLEGIQILDQKNVAVERDMVNIANFRKEKPVTGIFHLFCQRVQMLFASAFLGLGFQSLGLGHDFFDGLIS